MFLHTHFVLLLTWIFHDIEVFFSCCKLGTHMLLAAFQKCFSSFVTLQSISRHLLNIFTLKKHQQVNSLHVLGCCRLKFRWFTFCPHSLFSPYLMNAVTACERFNQIVRLFTSVQRCDLYFNKQLHQGWCHNFHNVPLNVR